MKLSLTTNVDNLVKSLFEPFYETVTSLVLLTVLNLWKERREISPRPGGWRISPTASRFVRRNV
jgi:hypothetical protein